MGKLPNTISTLLSFALYFFQWGAKEMNWITPENAQWIVYISYVLFGISIILWLYYLLIKKRKKSNEKQSYINVESYNQQGGITAYQVNLQPNDRHLSDDDAGKLENYLNRTKHKSVEIDAVIGDGEAFRYASQIKNFLVSRGFNINGVNQVAYNAPQQGQSVFPPNDEGIAKIIIGNR